MSRHFEMHMSEFYSATLGFCKGSKLNALNMHLHPNVLPFSMEWRINVTMKYYLPTVVVLKVSTVLLSMSIVLLFRKSTVEATPV